MEGGNRLLKAGWSQADITPGGRVFLIGQHFARISEGVMDPVTATALALESVKDGRSAGHAVMVSCDLVSVSEELRSAVLGYAAGEPGLEHENIILNATHTHAAPHIRPWGSFSHYDGTKKKPAGEHTYGIELDALEPAEYVDFAAKKIAEAVKKAWRAREPSGIGCGLGHAVIGRNRRLCYFNGESRMYGRAGDPDFSHVEGYEDHSVYIMTVHGGGNELTGLVVNVACPAQVSESIFQISADFWHETREEIRKRFGENLFILAQCAPAGDQSPHVLTGSRAEQRMWRLKGRDLSQDAPRQEIAEKIAGAVEDVLPFVRKEIDRSPSFGFRREIVELPRRKITEDNVKEANERAEEHRKKYEELLREIEKNPSVKKEPRWYRPVTHEYSRMRWFGRVAERFELQRENPSLPAELSAFMLGGTAFAANPFELYLDYGVRMRELVKAPQVFLVQLAGSGGYLPSARSVSGGGYGSVPASTDVGPEGGEVLVDWTVGAINGMMENI